MIINERSRVTNGAMVHEVIAKTAKEMAASAYEKFAHNNEFYKMYPTSARYIQLEWARFVPDARKILSKMLGMKHVPTAQKEIIMDALLLDRSLPEGRIHGVVSSLKKATRH